MSAQRSTWMREFQHRSHMLGGRPTAGAAGLLYNEGRGAREAAEAMYGHTHTKPARDCTCKVKVVGKLTHKSRKGPKRDYPQPRLPPPRRGPRPRAHGPLQLLGQGIESYGQGR